MSVSSPFIESPRRESHYKDYSDQISSLKYQLSALETEKQLQQQESINKVSQLEVQLTKKNEDYNKLKTNFNFVYEEKSQLLSKIENQAQIHATNLDSLNRTITSLKSENSQKQRQFEDLNNSNDRTVRKYEHVRSDLNYQLNLNDQLTQEIASLKASVINVQKSNDDLISKLKADNTSDLASSANSISKLNANLNLKNTALQRTNNELQVKIDKLLQNKTSVELLKQKNITLSSKVSQLEAIQEKYYQLEINHIELNDKLIDFTRILDEKLEDVAGEDVETKIKNFIGSYNNLQYDSLVYKDKFAEANSELAHSQKKLAELNVTIEDMTQELSSLNEQLAEKSSLIVKLERTKALNLQEVEYLRNSLKELDQINLRRDQENDDNNKSTGQYLSNLEKLVDGYKAEIASLQKSKPASANETQNKRPRLLAESFTNRSVEVERENIQLLSKIKRLEGQTSELNSKIQTLSNLQQKKQQLQILQLKSNPAAHDQVVKQQTLDLLRKENESLIEKYINNEIISGSDLIPKAIFERQENDKAILQSKIDQLSKRINRLKLIYSQKSKDILTIISKYFGYIIEFLPSSINPNDLSSRMKLTSRYMTEQDSTSYLVIDIESKSLKAYGNYEFKQLYEELSSSYGHEQIPCFLSALNLKIYEKYISI